MSDSYDSIQNIRGGAKQLRHLLNLYQGDLPLALAAYNAGVHRVKNHKVPRIRETRTYVKKVCGTMKCFVLPHSLLSGMKRSERSANQVEIPFIRHTRQDTGYPGARFILWRMCRATNGSTHRGGCDSSHPFTRLRKGKTDRVEKVSEGSFLELGRHDHSSNSFTLGRPDPRKLKTEICAFDPSH